MKNYGYAVAVILFFLPVAAESATVYKCEIKASAELRSDGTLREASEKFIRAISPMIIDLQSGVVRMGENEKAARWKVVLGGEFYDWVLKRDSGREAEDVVNDTTIRLTVTSEREWLVIHYFAGGLYTGTCKGLD